MPRRACNPSPRDRRIQKPPSPRFAAFKEAPVSLVCNTTTEAVDLPSVLCALVYASCSRAMGDGACDPAGSFAQWSFAPSISCREYSRAASPAREAFRQWFSTRRRAREAGPLCCERSITEATKPLTGTAHAISNPEHRPSMPTVHARGPERGEVGILAAEDPREPGRGLLSRVWPRTGADLARLGVGHASCFSRLVLPRHAQVRAPRTMRHLPSTIGPAAHQAAGPRRAASARLAPLPLCLATTRHCNFPSCETYSRRPRENSSSKIRDRCL